MVYLFLADGFEETEAFGTTDVLRRCGLEVQLLSVTGKRVVTGAHGIVVKADSLFRKNHILHSQALVLPGGLKGTETLRSNPVLRLTLQQRAKQGELIAAICAAPIVLGAAGVLEGVHATCYPGLASQLDGAIMHNTHYVVEDGNFITASGPAATVHFAFAIAKRLASPTIVAQVKKDMLFEGYTQPDTRNHTLEFNNSTPDSYLKD